MARSTVASRVCSLVGIACLGIVTSPAGFAATAGSQVNVTLERQRALSRSVFETVERGDWTPVDRLAAPHRTLLEQYILWPDLRATWLRANIDTVSAHEINGFVQQYGILRPVRELRYRYALHLARNRDLPAYLKLYEQFYQGRDFKKLDCLALQAEIGAGRHQRVALRALDLWMVGKSQVSECDPVFKYLDDRKLLGLVEYRQRYDLAIEARNFTLAHWLAEKIDRQHIDLAAQWQQAQTDPETFLRQQRYRSGDGTLRAQLVYAAERLTYRDPDIARKLWGKVSGKHRFSAAQKLRTAQHIALWTARDNLPGAYGLLLKLPAAAQNDEVLRWRARSSLRAAHWQRLLTDIGAMPDAERRSGEWRYWHAIAQTKSGTAPAAMRELDSLRLERSFYGFLAADKLGKEYALDTTVLPADEDLLATLEMRPEVTRARELFTVGQEGRARSEWDAVLRNLSDQDKIQAAILAHRWGWHSRAMAAAASLGQYDDLSIRYPLPYQESFQAFSALAGISSTWAYGVARSESHFMRDARSHAGAIGLMQLMPATGRNVARDIKLPYSGLATLVDPQSNIRLGTTYLGQMAERYHGNQVLATAAYNAGPQRVDRWLPQHGTIDARIWIENIPLDETRHYVKRVLAAQAIFYWRMTGKIRRLSDQLAPVYAMPEMQQITSR